MNDRENEEVIVQQPGQQPYRPFVFLLQEGEEIKRDPMDYSLRLLHINEQVAIAGPEDPKDPPQFRGPFLRSFGQELRTSKNDSDLPF